MIEQLRKELSVDEGCVMEIYKDHLGLNTCGVGHLIKEGDPEYDMEVGDPVSEERVAELFEKDIAWTITDCKKLLPDYDNYPLQIRLIVANMCYNLGKPRLSGFKRLLSAIEDRNWQAAAAEMEDSRWSKQLPNRSRRLIIRMQAVPADPTSEA